MVAIMLLVLLYLNLTHGDVSWHALCFYCLNQDQAQCLFS